MNRIRTAFATLLFAALPAMGAGDPATYEGRVEIAIAKTCNAVASEVADGATPTAEQIERGKVAQQWASNPSGAAAYLIPNVRAVTAATDQAAIDSAVSAILTNLVKLKRRAETPAATPTPAATLTPGIQRALIGWAKAVSAAAEPTDVEKATAQVIYGDPKSFAARIEPLVVEQDATLVPGSSGAKFRAAVDAVLSASVAVAKPAASTGIALTPK